jgi:PAS domain S-box-containing protein
MASSILVLILAASGIILMLCFGLVIAHYRSANRALAADVARLRRNGSGVIEADTRFRVFSEYTPMGCIVSEPGFRILEWSHQAEQIFGWTREEMVGANILGTVIPAYLREQMIRDATTLFAAGTFFHPGVPHVTRDGRNIVCEWHHSLVRDDQGVPTRVVSLCVDVTRVRRLSRDNALFRSIVELTDEPAVLVLDPRADGRVRYANQAACRHFGKSLDDLLGTTPADWDRRRCPENMPEFWHDVHLCKVRNFETEHRHASGEVIPVEVTTNQIEHEGRVFIAAYIRNTTERIANEAHMRELEVRAALHEHETRYREVFENSSDALFIIDVGADGRLVFDSVNPVAAAAFGVAADDLKGIGLDDIAAGRLGLPGTSLAHNLHQYRDCAKGSPTEYEGRLDLGNDQGARRFRVHLVPLTGTRGVHRIIGIGHDVTPIRRYESELAQRAKLQERIAALAAAVPGFLFTIRVDADGRAHFPYASPGVEEIAGLRPEEFRDDASVLRARYHPDDLPGMVALMAETTCTLAPFRIEIRIDHPKKGQRWVEIRSTPQRQPDGATEWHGLMIDITARKETERHLVESRALLRDLCAYREDAREEDRKRIARDLHEELGQLLTALRMTIATLPLQYGDLLPALHDLSDGMCTVIDEAILAMRTAVSSLRPATLNSGLAAGLEWLARDFSHRSGIPCQLQLAEEMPPLGDKQATAVFRIAQEALANAERHARAGHVGLRFFLDGGRWHLEVQDDGCGFDAAAANMRSFGILGMSERATSIGGDFDIRSSPQYGTVVRLGFSTS